jgi:uncharacterized protein (DUF983 family)
MICPYCKEGILYLLPEKEGYMCEECGHRFSWYEMEILQQPVNEEEK